MTEARPGEGQSPTHSQGKVDESSQKENCKPKRRRKTSIPVRGDVKNDGSYSDAGPSSPAKPAALLAKPASLLAQPAPSPASPGPSQSTPTAAVSPFTGDVQVLQAERDPVLQASEGRGQP